MRRRSTPWNRVLQRSSAGRPASRTKPLTGASGFDWAGSRGVTFSPANHYHTGCEECHKCRLSLPPSRSRPPPMATVRWSSACTTLGVAGRAMLEALEPLLDDGYRLVVPDLRGHGDSPSPAGPWSIDDFASDVARLAAQEGGGAIAVGLGLGAATALAVALGHPGMIGGLVAERPRLPRRGRRRARALGARGAHAAGAAAGRGRGAGRRGDEHPAGLARRAGPGRGPGRDRGRRGRPRRAAAGPARAGRLDPGLPLRDGARTSATTSPPSVQASSSRRCDGSRRRTASRWRRSAPRGRRRWTREGAGGRPLVVCGAAQPVM